MRDRPAGGYVFIQGVLTMDNIEVVEGTTFFMGWRTQRTWRFPYQQFLEVRA